MLDFYFISDSDSKPNPKDIEDLEYAGGIETANYDRLIRIGLIDERFDYYNDFQWSTTIVKQINERLSKPEIDKSNTDVKALQGMIDKAIEKNCGLIAYSD